MNSIQKTTVQTNAIYKETVIKSIPFGCLKHSRYGDKAAAKLHWSLVGKNKNVGTDKRQQSLINLILNLQLYLTD